MSRRKKKEKKKKALVIKFYKALFGVLQYKNITIKVANGIYIKINL